VAFLDRWRARWAWDGSTGRPRSGNGASSFHLAWHHPEGRWVAAEATLEVVVPPVVPKLYFWALQVSFADRGRIGGGAHLGLQWHGEHPRGTAVNWGGYGPDGGELRGSTSPLPSATGNVNTRDYDWRPQRRYRLRVERAARPGPGGVDAWQGSVAELPDGPTTVVRDLWASGTLLTSPMVWSEVFADCDDPTVTVRWSDLHLVGDDARPVEVRSVGVNYQAIGDGGCRDTNSLATADGFVQTTATERSTRQGARLVLP
jgi:hypothetical protein